MSHDSANVLGGRSSSTSVVKGVCFVGYEAKGDACWYFETMGKGIDLAFHARVVVEDVAVKVAKLRGVPLKGGASKGRGNVGFHKGNPFEGDQVLEALDKQHHVHVVNVLANRNYLAFTMCFIKMGVEIAEI